LYTDKHFKTKIT